MISDWEIWGCANLVIKQHGDGATFYAAGRADDMLERGDMEGKRVWCRILAKIEELERTELHEGEGLQ